MKEMEEENEALRKVATVTTPAKQSTNTADKERIAAL